MSTAPAMRAGPARLVDAGRASIVVTSVVSALGIQPGLALCSRLTTEGQWA